jgi:hypothetical protein
MAVRRVVWRMLRTRYWVILISICLSMFYATLVCLSWLMMLFRPLLYGEGDKAFLRLQEEIIKVEDTFTRRVWPPIPLPQYFSLRYLAPPRDKSWCRASSAMASAPMCGKCPNLSATRASICFYRLFSPSPSKATAYMSGAPHPGASLQLDFGIVEIHNRNVEKKNFEGAQLLFVNGNGEKDSDGVSWHGLERKYCVLRHAVLCVDVGL